MRRAQRRRSRRAEQLRVCLSEGNAASADSVADDEVSRTRERILAPECLSVCLRGSRDGTLSSFLKAGSCGRSDGVTHIAKEWAWAAMVTSSEEQDIYHTFEQRASLRSSVLAVEASRDTRPSTAAKPEGTAKHSANTTTAIRLKGDRSQHGRSTQLAR
jgi:hypothetical protein